MAKEIPLDEKFTNAELDDFTVDELKELFTDYELEVPKGNKPDILAEAYKHFSSEYVQEDEGTGEPNEAVEGDILEEPQAGPKPAEIDIDLLTNVEIKKPAESASDGIRAMEDMRGQFLSPVEVAHYNNQARVEALEAIRNPESE